MSKARKLATVKTNGQLSAIHPHAGGIDIGATQLQVAVPCDADPKPVRTFTTFTDDLLKLRDWLKACGVKTVAMESTGVYWIPLYQILAAAGVGVCLVNARHCKNLPGRKTDVSDCQWLQYLHSVGLLRASFRPPEHICAVRSLLRHRANLVRYASQQVMHLQKALTHLKPVYELGSATDDRITGGIVPLVRMTPIKRLWLREANLHVAARRRNNNSN